MAPTRVWKLKRFGRLVSDTGESSRRKPWEVFDSNGNKTGITLKIVEPGYLLVLQGQEILDTISLLCGSDLLKVHRKSDNLMLRITTEGESRMIRMQFDGRNQTESLKKCLSAKEKMTEYMSVNTHDDAPPPHNQPPAEVAAAAKQPASVGAEPEGEHGSLSIRRLTERFLGETAVTLPQVFHHSPLAQGDLESILRVCLLDPGFHALVESLEGEVRKLLQE